MLARHLSIYNDQMRHFLDFNPKGLSDDALRDIIHSGSK